MARSVPLALPAMIVTTFSFMRARKILARALSDGGSGGIGVGLGLDGVLGARRGGGGDGDETDSASEGDTHHEFPLFERASLVNAGRAPRERAMRGGGLMQP